MKFFLIFLMPFLVLLTGGRLNANLILADFDTTKGKFTISLDFQNSPLAVANFILLAGKADDIYETPAANPYFLEQAEHSSIFYQTTGESDVQRIALKVERVEQTSTMRAFYGIYQQGRLIGGVEEFSSGFHADITGEDRFRLQQIGGPQSKKYRITLRYPKNWLDASDTRIEPAPMYQALKIWRVDTGRKFFAGGKTDNPFEHPGYQFQDEIFRTPIANPVFIKDYHGFPFSSAGVLAMEGGRLKNQNGSRFFITSVRDDSLNGQHTAFGTVFDNQSFAVINSIANTPTIPDSFQVPDEEMFITGITFRRSGLLAAAFMESYWRTFLPDAIQEVPLSIDRTQGRLDIVTPLRPQSQNFQYLSTDLQNYSVGTITNQPPSATEPFREDFTRRAVFAPKVFFKMFSTDLPVWPSAEFSLENVRLDLRATSDGDSGVLLMDFGVEGTGGSYSTQMVIEQPATAFEDGFTESVNDSGDFTATYTSTGPYVGVLKITSSTGDLNTDELTLHFDSSRYTYDPLFKSPIIMRFDSRRTTDPETPTLTYSGLFQRIQRLQ